MLELYVPIGCLEATDEHDPYILIDLFIVYGSSFEECLELLSYSISDLGKDYEFGCLYGAT